MSRIHPKDVPSVQIDEVETHEEEDKKLVLKSTEFSLNVGVKYMNKRLLRQLGRSNLYFMAGMPIEDESYLNTMTVALCEEYGLDFMDVMADLILPCGFSHPSLSSSLQSIVADAFKPVFKLGQQKLIVWVDDEQWNDPVTSISEILMCQLLLKRTEPFLLSSTYFDPQSLSKLTQTVEGFDDIPLSSASADHKTKQCRSQWKSFSLILKFGYLLLLRSSACPIIVTHFSQKIAQKVNAFELLDLANSEGHVVMYLKNIASSAAERQKHVADIVKKILELPFVNSNHGIFPETLRRDDEEGLFKELLETKARQSSPIKTDCLDDDGNQYEDDFSLDSEPYV